MCHLASAAQYCHGSFHHRQDPGTSSTKISPPSRMYSAAFHRAVFWAQCGVLFLLYTAEVLYIVHHHGLAGHYYADDTCIYVHVDTSSCAAVLSTVTPCLDAINSWMTSNRLKLNMDKTQFIWLGTAQQLAKVNIRSIALNDVNFHLSDKVTCLGPSSFWRLLGGYWRLLYREHLVLECMLCGFNIMRIPLDAVVVKYDV